jgi:hypothetical protein
MTQLRDTQLASHHLERALECSCVASITLEAMRAQTNDVTNEIRVVQDQLNELIQYLRAALDDVRRASGEESSPLAFGFVVEEADGPGLLRPKSRRSAC